MGRGRERKTENGKRKGADGGGDGGSAEGGTGVGEEVERKTHPRPLPVREGSIMRWGGVCWGKAGRLPGVAVSRLCVYRGRGSGRCIGNNLRQNEDEEGDQFQERLQGVSGER